MLLFFKKLFSSKKKTPPVVYRTPKAQKNEKDLETFVKYVVYSLVNNHKAVKINTTYAKNKIDIKVSCQATEVGKIVGKKGQTIGAIRLLLNGAGGRFNKKINLEVVDN